MISVQQVTHRFGERVVLRDVTVELPERRIGIVGGNGSGKSTFARLFNGLVVPTSGRVYVDGLDTRREARTVRQRVGFCFTDPDAQVVLPTVAEDVAFGLRRSGLAKQQTQDRVEEVLREYGLDGHADHPTHLLSGGQKQLLALAGVLVTEPSILVCDEPTTLLDLRNARMVTEVLRGLTQQVIVVSHQLDLLADFDRVLVFAEGAIAYDGEPAAALDFYRASTTAP